MVRCNAPTLQMCCAFTLSVLVATTYLIPMLEGTFLEHLTRLEKTGLDFRPNYEGYIVSLDSEPRKPLLIGDGKIVLLTARDFESDTELVPVPSHSRSAQSWSDIVNVRLKAAQFNCD